VSLQERRIGQAPLEQVALHRQRHRHVGARPDGQVQIGEARERR